MTTKTKRVSKAKAEQVLRAVKKQFAPWGEDSGPVLEFDYDGYDGAPVIIWEEGAPYGWVFLVFDGGVEEEFGFKIKAVPRVKGVWVEPVNNCVLALFPLET